MTDEGNRKREESLRVFSQAATIYDRVGPGIFSHFGQRLVDVAEIAAGANVLDVAAGRGALLIPAAAKVGANGQAMLPVSTFRRTWCARPLKILKARRYIKLKSDTW